MARPLRIQFPGAFYHITCRGIERRQIFGDDNDRYKFLVLLSASLETYQVVLYAYIMMKNHFHILIQTTKANCSEFMRYFNICYTGWFNYHHGRSGNLYQGRYKAFLVDADTYLLEVSRYLHLNSVRVHKLRSANYRERWRSVTGYRWSSLPGYLDERRVINFVNYDFILSIAGGRRGYRSFIVDGIKRDLDNPFERVKSRILLGDDDFVVKVKRKYVECGSLREQPSYRDLTVGSVEPDVVLGVVANEFGVTSLSLKKRGGNGIVRGITADLLYKYSDLTQAQIGRLLGDIDYGAVYLLRRRLKEKMNQDSDIKKRYQRVEARLNKNL